MLNVAMGVQVCHIMPYDGFACLFVIFYCLLIFFLFILLIANLCVCCRCILAVEIVFIGAYAPI